MSARSVLLPTTDDWPDIAAGYFENTQFPNTVGAVNILIYFLTLNMKKNYSNSIDILFDWLSNS